MFAGLYVPVSICLPFCTSPFLYVGVFSSCVEAWLRGGVQWGPPAVPAGARRGVTPPRRPAWGSPGHSQRGRAPPESGREGKTLEWSRRVPCRDPSPPAGPSAPPPSHAEDPVGPVGGRGWAQGHPSSSSLSQETNLRALHPQTRQAGAHPNGYPPDNLRPNPFHCSASPIALPARHFGSPQDLPPRSQRSRRSQGCWYPEPKTSAAERHRGAADAGSFTTPTSPYHAPFPKPGITGKPPRSRSSALRGFFKPQLISLK